MDELKGRARGGAARAALLTPERPREIAQMGVAARWRNRNLQGEMKMPAKKKLETISIRLPKETIDVLETVAKQGILGTTIEEVSTHVLKQKLFEMITIQIISEKNITKE